MHRSLYRCAAGGGGRWQLRYTGDPSSGDRGCSLTMATLA